MHVLPAAARDFIQKNVGLIFQVPYVIDELSVLENVMVKGLIANDMHIRRRKKGPLSFLKKLGWRNVHMISCKSLSGESNSVLQ